MNVKACLFGAVLGFFIAAAPSCGGSSSNCGPQNCGGCCNAKGICIARSASNTDSVCGTQGNACVDCTASNSTCDTSSFTCKASGTGGGTAATGGGTTATGGGTTGTGGGTAATGGGTSATGGGTATSNCNINSQNCNTGEACMYSNANGTVTRCSAGLCDLVDTATCAANQKCTYVGGLFADGGAGRMCEPVGGTQVEGSACSVTAADVCGPGLACLGTATNGVCMKACYKHGDCGTGRCAVGPISSPNKGEFPAFCARGCGILAQSCGNAFEGCYPSDETFTSGVCSITQGKVLGAACQFVDECAGGSLCLAPKSGGSALCVKICNMDAGSPSCGPDGGTCTVLQGGLGACAP